MHNGRVGGGRPGISKYEFLAWIRPGSALPRTGSGGSKHKLIEIAEDDGKIRIGIAVGKLQDPDLSRRIWAFVESVQRFKEQAARGIPENA